MTTDLNSLITLISGSSIIATLFIALVKKLIKTRLVARFGDIGIQVALFCISLILAIFTERNCYYSGNDFEWCEFNLSGIMEINNQKGNFR